MFPRLVSLSGLMAGAMAPDLIYFLMGTTTDRSVSHSWEGMFSFCLPAGTAFALAFHWLFKRAFLSSLPYPLDRYFSGLAVSRFEIRGIRAWIVLVISVAVGTLSHFFWDSFTHAQGQLVPYFPILLEYREIFGQQVQIARIAQHVSTLAGAAVMLLYLISGLLIPPATVKFRPKPTGEKLSYWATVIVGSGAAVAVGWWAWLDPAHLQHFIDRHVSGYVTVIGLSSWAGFFWATCLFAILTKQTGNALPGKNKPGKTESVTLVGEGKR
jgi:hypothetical protein